MPNSTFLSKLMWSIFFEISMIFGWIFYTKFIFPMCPIQTKGDTLSPEVALCLAANITAYGAFFYLSLMPVFRAIGHEFSCLLAKFEKITAD
jgi:hypothetical protein